MLAEEATEDEIRAAALQYVRKVSGFRAPAAHNQEVFDEAVEAVAKATTELLANLEITGRHRSATSLLTPEFLTSGRLVRAGADLPAGEADPPLAALRRLRRPGLAAHRERRPRPGAEQRHQRHARRQPGRAQPLAAEVILLYVTSRVIEGVMCRSDEGVAKIR